MLLKLLAGVLNPSLSLRQLTDRRSKDVQHLIKAPLQAPGEAHLAILKMGVSIWNHWRSQNPQVRPVLANASLTGLDLENVNLSGANLSGANLSRCYLYEADFQGADLRKANFSRAGLIGANLHKANLSGANLNRTYLAQSDLSHANLSRASLQEADLHLALLTRAALKQATLAKTVMTDCLDLTLAQLQAAQDAHLALCPPLLETQLSLVAVSSHNELETSELETSELEAYPTHKAIARTKHRTTLCDRQCASSANPSPQAEASIRTLCPTT